MKRCCEHCGELIVGSAYRVTSEDKGIRLLDMIVCSLCFIAAKRLRLHAEEIDVRKKTSSARSTSNIPPPGIRK